MSEEIIDEILESVWVGRRLKHEIFHHLQKHGNEGNYDSILNEMNEQNLIEVDGEELILLPDGKSRAEGVVRRHRLAERLLMDVLGIGSQHAHDSACKFEHILSPEVTESVCTFLGHPPVCPHNKPIPRGACCKELSWKLEPVLMRLIDLNIGQEGKVVFIHTQYHQRLEHLSTFGIVPGSIIRLHQKSPSFVLEIGETTLALDKEIIGEIYVKKV